MFCTYITKKVQNWRYFQVSRRMLFLVIFSCLFLVKLPVLHVHLLWYFSSLDKSMDVFETSKVLYRCVVHTYNYYKKALFLLFLNCYNFIVFPLYLFLIISFYVISQWWKSFIYLILSGCSIWHRWTNTQTWRGLCCIFTYNNGKKFSSLLIYNS